MNEKRMKKPAILIKRSSQNKTRNIVFVAGLHGNEQMPVKALRENKVPFVLGNPKAYKKDVRFIERDLNASFGIRNAKYESQRASEILKEIDKKDVVVDFHSTTAITVPFVIIVDEKMIPLAETAGLRNVVLMRHNIKKGHALINYRKGISIETGNHSSQKSHKVTLKVVKNILAGKKHPIRIFEVYGKILKPGRYHNFKKHSDGFIPVLAGEEAYDFYGLKAR